MLLPKDAVSGIGCDEFLWSRTLRSYTEQAFACVSGRIANNMLNMMLHRNSDIDSIKLRTMTDMVECIVSNNWVWNLNEDTSISLISHDIVRKFEFRSPRDECSTAVAPIFGSTH